MAITKSSLKSTLLPKFGIPNPYGSPPSVPAVSYPAKSAQFGAEPLSALAPAVVTARPSTKLEPAEAAFVAGSNKAVSVRASTVPMLTTTPLGPINVQPQPAVPAQANNQFPASLAAAIPAASGSPARVSGLDPAPSLAVVPDVFSLSTGGALVSPAPLLDRVGGTTTVRGLGGNAAVPDYRSPSARVPTTFAGSGTVNSYAGRPTSVTAPATRQAFGPEPITTGLGKNAVVPDYRTPAFGNVEDVVTPGRVNIPVRPTAFGDEEFGGWQAPIQVLVNPFLDMPIQVKADPFPDVPAQSGFPPDLPAITTKKMQKGAPPTDGRRHVDRQSGSPSSSASGGGGYGGAGYGGGYGGGGAGLSGFGLGDVPEFYYGLVLWRL